MIARMGSLLSLAVEGRQARGLAGGGGLVGGTGLVLLAALVSAGAELGDDPGGWVDQLALIGLLDPSEDGGGFVVREAEAVPDELARRMVRAAGHRLHQEHAAPHQLPAGSSVVELLVLGLPASSGLAFAVGRAARLGTGGWGGIKGGVRGCRGRGATIQGGVGGL